MAHEVFISYSARDKATADAVCATLEAWGIRCWIAPRNVPYGSEWGAAIVDAIHASRVMVLVFSAEANDSPYIRREVERAVGSGVTIIPLRIEDVVPGKSLEYFIGSVHWLDALTPPLEHHLQRLAESVRSFLPVASGPPGPLPPPLPPALAGDRPRRLATRRLILALAGVAAILCVVGAVGLSLARPGRGLRSLAAAQAMYDQAIRIWYGPVAEDSDKKAVDLFREAAKLGLAAAQDELAELLIRTSGTMNDPAEGEGWLHKAVDQNYAPAAFHLGLVYCDELWYAGHPRNPKEATKWFRKSAELGYPPAQTELGRILLEGWASIQKDPKEAVAFFLAAAKQGHPPAQYELGLCYEKGDGVAKNDDAALDWFQKAAQQGFAPAELVLGVRYDEGRGVAKNADTARELFERAAKKGYCVAQFELGACFEQGRGAPRDLDAAQQWYEKASRQGYRPATDALLRLRRGAPPPPPPPGGSTPD